MDKIKIGFVGLNFGEYVLSELMNSKYAVFFDITAVCDLDRMKTIYLAERWGCKAYFSLDDLLDNKSIKAIGLFTSPENRAGLIDKIITSGRDVMTTKPFELNADKAMQVLMKAKKTGRIIHMNSPSATLSPELVQVEKWRKKYNLGVPIGCRADVWATAREKPDGRWYDDPERCPAAPVFRIGIYLINDLLRLFGKAEKVQVMSSRIFTERPTSDNANLVIMFEGGAICNIYASFCVNDGQAYKNSLVINFENGTVYRNIGSMQWDSSNSVSHMSLITRQYGEAPVEENISFNTISGDYRWEEFYRGIKGEKLDHEVTPDEIVEAIRIVDAMARAEKSGCVEYIER